MSDLPAPLTPADCDLRGLEYMPLLGAHLFGSEFNARATDSEWRAAITLWWAAWGQMPAASLPDDDAALCRFADLGRDVKSWRKLREGALHGWVKCSDGRLYHPVLARQAEIAWEKRQRERQDRSADLERKSRERTERSKMFADLAAIGVTPEWNIKTRDLRALVTENVRPHSTGSHAPVTRDRSPPVTPDVTAKTGRDGTLPPNPQTGPPGQRFADHRPEVRRVLEVGRFAAVPPDVGLVAEWLALPNMQLERDVVPMIEKIAGESMATGGRAPFRLKYFDGRIREKHAEDEAEIARLQRVTARIELQDREQRTAAG